MYLINHYLEAGEGSVLFSDPVDAPTINSVPSCVDSPSLPILLGRVTLTFVASLCGRIIANVDECVPLGNGRNPNFILMDYVDLGSPLAAVNQLNGLA
jgi:hypothetical protein